MTVHGSDLRGFVFLIYGVGVTTVTAVSSWILGRKLHRRIRRALGKDVEDETELTSLDTWMKVEDREEQKEQR
jgi:hypothetical protein